MKSRQTAPSVVARLMGLDELPPQEPPQKPKRVLSENYLRKVASIGVGRKRPSHEVSPVAKMAFTRQKCRGANCPSVCEKPQVAEQSQDSLEHLLKGNLLTKNLHDLQGSLPLSHSGPESLPSSVLSNVDNCRQSRSENQLGYLKPFQRIENGSLTRSHGKELGLSFHERSQMVSQNEECYPDTRIIVLKPMHDKAESSERSIASMEILKELSRRKRYRQISFSTKVPRLGLRGGDTFATTTESLTPPSYSSSDRRNRYQSFSSSDKSYVASEAKMQLVERWRMTENFTKGQVAPRGTTLDKMLARHDFDSKPRNDKPGRHGLKELNLSQFSKQNSKTEAFKNKLFLRKDESLNWARQELKKHNSDQKNGSETKDLKSNSLEGLVSVEGIRFVNSQSSNCSISCSHMEDNISSQEILVGKDDDTSSHVTDTSVQQGISIEFHEESCTFSRCSGTEQDSLASLEEAYQPSPVSVLEPSFSEENSYGWECLGRINDDICDLQRDIELLKSETSESCSEGSGMAVSSDDENVEESTDNYKEQEQFMKIFRVDESRNFSYLIEVLTEASLHGKNLEKFSNWDSPEYPISLLVFETLEKKYGDQMSWRRSERRFLFDRINAGLLEILLPCTGVPTWAKSVSRRLTTSLNEEMIEEDLWKLLVSQEKEGSSNSAEDLLGSEVGKLDLGDEIDSIVREIVISFIDELAEELIST
ncbi:hypothetical protein UlMin_025730 [Ulmus minor]